MYEEEQEYEDDTDNDDDNDDNDDDDITHSSFLICRIAIFLYAFVSILISVYFPGKNESQINAKWRGWMQFYIVINVIACCLGMSGIYLNKTKFIFICWVLLLISLLLTGILLISYIFNKNDGVELESNARCLDWINNDDTFNSKYTFNDCFNKMKTQLLWTVIGLYIIYCIGGAFGIHIIRHTEKHINQYLIKKSNNNNNNNNNNFYYDYQIDDDQQSQSNLSDLSDDQYHDIDHHEPNEYDINLEHKKNK